MCSADPIDPHMPLPQTNCSFTPPPLAPNYPARRYRWVVFFFFAALFAFGVTGATKNTEGFDANKLVLDDSHFKAYNTMNEDYGLSTYNAKAPVGIYYKGGGLELQKAEVQANIMELNTESLDLSHNVGPVYCWLDSFLAWLPSESDTCATGDCDYSSGYSFADEATFLAKLNAFLAVSANSIYSTDIALDETTGSVVASRCWVWHIDIGDVPNQIEAMDEMVAFLDSNPTGLATTPFADSWMCVPRAACVSRPPLHTAHPSLL
jgi:hypothetical protein